MPDDETLARLFCDDEPGLAQLREGSLSPRATVIETEHGPVTALDGKKLHSTRNPRKEARRFVRGLDLSDADVVVLLGLGSGYVVEAIRLRSDADIIVFEPDLDTVRLALTQFDPPEHFRIVTDAERLGRSVYQALRSGDRGIVASWAPSARRHHDAFEEAHTQCAQAVDRAGLRDRTARYRGAGWLDHYLDNLPNVLDGPGLAHLRGCLEGVPAIIVAAGPSLDRNVRQLAALRDRAFIICVNTAAGALARAGIRPHAVVAVESLDVSAQLRDLPWIEQVPAFLDLTAHPGLWKVPFAQRVPFSSDSSSCCRFTTRLDPRHHIHTGYCVANAATALAHALGCRDLILVGSDLAYTGNRAYASGTLFEEMRVEHTGGTEAKLTGLAAKRAIEEASPDAMKGSVMPDTARLEYVTAWGGEGTVASNRDFLMFRDWYTISTENLAQSNVRIINATEGGLRIPGTEEMTLAAAAASFPAPADETVETRFTAALSGPACDPDTLYDAVRKERDMLLQSLRIALEARALVGHHPDGDLVADAHTQERISGLNIESLSILREAPLATEVLFEPLEDLRERSQFNTFTVYDAMEAPLTRLDEKLARLMQSIDTTRRRAS